MHLPKYVYLFWRDRLVFGFGTHPRGVFGRLGDAFGRFFVWFWVHSSTTGHGSDFLRMSLAVCLLLPNPRGRSWLPKTNFPNLFVVLSHFTLLKSCDVVRAASGGASGVGLGLRQGGDGGRIASFRPPLSPRHFVDPPFFGLSVECVFFEDVLNEITTFVILRRALAKGCESFLS